MKYVMLSFVVAFVTFSVLAQDDASTIFEDKCLGAGGRIVKVKTTAVRKKKVIAVKETSECVCRSETVIDPLAGKACPTAIEHFNEKCLGSGGRVVANGEGYGECHCKNNKLLDVQQKAKCPAVIDPVGECMDIGGTPMKGPSGFLQCFCTAKNKWVYPISESDTCKPIINNSGKEMIKPKGDDGESSSGTNGSHGTLTR